MRKSWLPVFSAFPTMFSTLSKIEIIILATFNLLSANALNLVKGKKKNLFRKGLNYAHSMGSGTKSSFITTYGKL